MFILVTSCKNEQTEKQEVVRKVVNEERICLIDNVFEVEGRAYASVDYLEVSEMDSNAKGQPIIQFPNGYSYFNNKLALENIEISKNASVIMQTASYDAEGNFNFNEAFKINGLVELFANSENERMKFVPFRIKILDNNITAINEIYIP